MLAGGSPSSISFKLSDLGPNSSAGSFIANLLLTTDDALDAIEASLATLTSTFSPGKPRTYTLTFTTPQGLRPGLHTVVLYIHPVAPAADPNLANNSVFSPIVIT
jgi:hypothetical protein